MKKNFIILAVFAFLVSSCKHELPEPVGTGGGSGTGGGGGGNGGGGGTQPPITCSSDTIYFQQQVLPILISNCTLSGCHDVASHQDGVILTSYDYVMSTADIEPGDPMDSDLYEVLIDNDPSDRMPRPPQAPLTAAQKQIIYKWIQQGAKNLSCVANSCDSTNVSFSNTIKPIITNKCGGCHGGGSPQAGINFSTYAGVKTKIDDGRLWGAINHLPGFSPMPKNGNKLSDCEITQFKKWIAAGAPNN